MSLWVSSPADPLDTLFAGGSYATFGTLVALAYAYEVSLAVFFDETPTIR